MGTVLTHRFTEAADYAREAHTHQVRKGTNVPYLAHLLGVASLVLDHGGDEDQAIAGLLHDVVEDQGTHHIDIVRSKFGERVARIVEACTDGTMEQKAHAQTPEEKRMDWDRRKKSYLEHLDRAQDDVLLVSGADKLHNARAILRDLQDPKIGESVFQRFTGGKDGTLWFYRSIAELMARHGQPMARELQAVTTAMDQES
ncbi:MAG: HD domain-containing protein [Rhodanobacteraceae bacterium]